MITDAYEYIDEIRSVAEMQAVLDSLTEPERAGVITLALRRSRHQFTWSFFAERYGIDALAVPKVFTNCNVCGIRLRTVEEDRMGMCERCAAE
jgi:hypothetical protein